MMHFRMTLIANIKKIVSKYHSSNSILIRCQNFGELESILIFNCLLDCSDPGEFLTELY